MNISSFGRRLLAAANGTAVGTLLGLGTAAFKNTGTSGNTVPLLDGVNTWSGVQTFSANPSVTGGAISFPATQVPSAGANDLDDYEEGTWTAAVTFGGGSTGIVYAQQEATYTKTGRLVFARLHLNFSNKGSSTGSALITGLPFNVGKYSTAHWGYFASMASLVDGAWGFFIPGTTTINLFTGGATGVSGMSNTNFTNTSDFIIAGIYEV